MHRQPVHLATGVGQDCQTPALWARLLSKHLSHVKQFGNGIDPQDTAAAECHFKNLVASGQGTSVDAALWQPLRCGPV